MVDLLTAEELSTDTHPMAATISTRGKLRLMLSQDMATTTNQDHTPSVTMSTRVIQDMPTLINTAAKLEATTSTRERLRLNQDMAITTNQDHTPSVTMSTRVIQDMPAHINTAAKPEATTSTRGRLRLMLSQDMLTPVITNQLTLSATTNQDHTPMDTTSTRAIQDMPALTNPVTKPEATTSTRGRLRLSQDMATTVTLPTGPEVMVTAMFPGPLLM